MPNRSPFLSARLADEYDRLKNVDPALDRFQARRTIRARDLLLWSASVGEVKTTALLPSNGRPNPIVVDDLVICSVFSPGRLVAFDRQTGRQRWALRLRQLGHNNIVHSSGTGLVYGGTSQKILAVEPATGSVRWTFSPSGRKGETIYSSPTIAGGRLFVGDRAGYFHCLGAETGEPIWRVHTSRARNNDVNCDPVVAGGVVAVSTNAARTFGFDVATGRECWRHPVDGPAIYCRPGGRRTALVRTEKSAYLFSVPDGRLVRQWTLRGYNLQEACVAGNLMLLVTNLAGRTDGGSWPMSALRAFRRGREVYSQTYPRWTPPVLRYDPATARVYEATSHGLGILNPATGVRHVVIRFDDDDDSYPPYEANYTHPPPVSDGILYAINFDGRVFALRHP